MLVQITNVFVLSGFSRNIIKKCACEQLHSFLHFWPLQDQKHFSLFPWPIQGQKTFWHSLAYAYQAEHIQICLCKKAQF